MTHDDSHGPRRRGPGGPGRGGQGPFGPFGPFGGFGPFAGFGGPGRGGPSQSGPDGPGAMTPPPWLTGLFGLGEQPAPRGPRVRRGDVRAAILDVIAAAHRRDETVNGYQVIQQIATRSREAWRPSPGSVYPTIAQLEDEGLIESDETRGRRSLRLTQAGVTYVAEHAEELAAVWEPFEEQGSATTGTDGRSDRADLKPEIGQVMSAVWQIVSNGSAAQREAAVDVLVDARRKLYGILADGPSTDEAPDSPERPGRELGGDDPS